MPQAIYKTIARQLKQAGFEMVRHGKGSHSVFNKEGLKRPIVVSWNLRDQNLAKQILRTAGLR